MAAGSRIGSMRRHRTAGPTAPMLPLLLRRLLALVAVAASGGAVAVAAAATPGAGVARPPAQAAVRAASAGALAVDVVGDRRLRLEARQIVAGPVRLVVRNDGRETHYMALLRTDRPLTALRTRGRWLREPGGVARVTVPSHRTGETSEVTLAPGRYVLVCRLARHLRRGVRTTLRVVAPDTPTAAGSITSPASATTTTAPATTPTSTRPPTTTMPTTPTTPTQTTPQPPGPVIDGKPLFQANCGGCHTLAAAGTTGTVGPNLGVSRPTREQVVLMVTGGISPPMPNFTGVLTPAEINAIAVFVAQAVGQT
jgi:mono/diheme cytochrome c family protein